MNNLKRFELLDDAQAIKQRIKNLTDEDLKPKTFNVRFDWEVFILFKLILLLLYLYQLI